MMRVAKDYLYLLVVGAVCALPSSTQAQVGERLALAVAKVCVNEAGWDSPPDCDLIWQVVRSHGETDLERLRWLRCHSPRVLDPEGRFCGEDRKRCAKDRGNCWWSRNLTTTGRKPSGWSETEVVPWARYRSRWLRVVTYCKALVAGGIPPRGWPCARAPDTWGGDMDEEEALDAGMVPLECRGTKNEGYLWSGVAFDA